MKFDISRGLRYRAGQEACPIPYNVMIGIVGSQQSQRRKVAALMAANAADTGIFCVDGDHVIRQLSDTAKAAIIGYSSVRSAVLDVLSSLNYNIVASNVLFTPDIARLVLDNHGSIIVVQSSEYLESVTGSYLGNKMSRQYDLYTRFNRYQKDVGKHDGLIIVDNESDYELPDTLNIVDILEEGDIMSIEDAIKKALAELESADAAPSTTEEKPQKAKQKPAKAHSRPPKTHEASPAVSKPIKRIPIVKEGTKDSENDDEVAAVFAKIAGGKMALIFPSDMDFESEVIGGITYNKITVEVPDLDNSKLQELLVVNATVQKSQTHTPTKQPDLVPKSKPQKPLLDSDLESMKAEKAKLDAVIREARAEGDDDTVKELRHLRRALCNKINKASLSE